MESIGAFLPLILIFGVFYILLIRPQQKKVKAHREMLNKLRMSRHFSFFLLNKKNYI